MSTSTVGLLSADADEVLTIAEAAELRGVSQEAVQRKVRDARVAAVEFNNQLWISRRELEHVYAPKPYDPGRGRAKKEQVSVADISQERYDHIVEMLRVRGVVA